MKSQHDGIKQFADKSGLSTYYAAELIKSKKIPLDIARAEQINLNQKTYFFKTKKVVDFILNNPTMFSKRTVKTVRDFLGGKNEN